MDQEHFQSAQDPASPEEPTAAPEQPSPPAEESEPELILGKFKNVDDLAKSFSHAESKLGEMGNELGQLRERLAQYEQQQPETPQVELNENTVSWFDEQSAQNPYAAAVWAMQNDPSGVLYNRALDTWFEIQPRAAAQFERQVEMQGLKQEIAQTLGQTLQPLAKSQAEQNFSAAYQSVRTKHPDLDEHAEGLMAVGQEFPDMLQSLRTGSRESAERVLEGLLAIKKMRDASGAPPQTPPQSQAFVATASSSTASEDKGLNEDDEALRAWKMRLLQPSPMSLGS